MRPTIQDAAQRILLDMALGNQGDVLGFHSFGSYCGEDDEEGEEVSESDQLDFIRELATDALSSSQPYVVERVLRWPTLRRMDLVTAALIEHHGINAAVACVLADAVGSRNGKLAICDEDNAENADGSARVIVQTDREAWSVMITDEILWHSQGCLELPAMPETVIASLAGAPLARVLSHPILDNHGFVIASAAQINGGTVVTLAERPMAMGIDEIKSWQRARGTRMAA